MDFERMKLKRIVITLVLTPKSDERTVIQGLKQLLKRMWRNYGLKCSSIRTDDDDSEV
jgi:hypothetical protein